MAEQARQVIAMSPVVFENIAIAIAIAIAISISIGIASNRDLNSHSTDPLLAAADEARYRAKEKGSNRVETETA